MSARAYCGPAHGSSWPVGTAGPAERVELAGKDGGVVLYRLVWSYRTRRPARDRLGNYLYLPVHQGSRTSPDEARATVLRLPRTRRRRPVAAR